MLDIGGANSLPPTIVVGRTLSAYDVPDVTNNQETLTFTVYNESGSDITGVLLTDTLETGVTFASASQLPDQNGQQLAWSLGTIPALGDATVTLTVSLASPTPTTLDAGASVFGTLDAGTVNWTTAPATLRTTAIAADLLASTSDANTTDPYVQEKAAELNYDPTQIFNFLQTQIGYNSYTGSLRGARGTLWSSAGNSLDDASLGVALMRASGIPAEYEQGTLSQSQAQQLILSMFPASYQTVGYIPAGTQTSDPANDPQLLSETEQHYWFQFDTGSGMQDADPEFDGQAIGQTATTSSNSFTEVPDNLRQKTEVSLTVEQYSAGAAAFGLNPFGDTTVLDQTFNDVDLVGRSVVLGHIVQQTAAGALAFGSITTTYSPYLAVFDEGSTADQAQIIKGTQYQDVLSSFPFATQAITGIFLNIQLTGPNLSAESYQYTIADRIGYVARQSGGPLHLNASTGSAPLLTNFDVFNIEASGSAPNPSNLSPMIAEMDAISSRPVPSGVVPSDGTATLNLAAEEAHAISATFYDQSDDSAQLLSDTMLVKAYEDRPRIMIVAHQVAQISAGSVSTDVSVDLTRNSLRVIPIPGQNLSEIESFNVMRGLLDTYLEDDILSQSAPGSAAIGAGDVLSAAAAQNIPLAVLDAGTASTVDSLSISAEGKARISSAIANGDVVVVPTQEVTLNGGQTVAWLEVNPATGETIGVSENGLHNGIIAFGAITVGIGTLITLGFIVAASNAYNQFHSQGEDIGTLYAACHVAALAAKSDKQQRVCQEGFKHAKDKAKAFAEEVDHRFSILSKAFGDPAETGLKDGIHDALARDNLAGPKDPPLPTALVGDIAGGTGELDSPINSSALLPLAVTSNRPAGSVSGQGNVTRVAAAGAFTASWSSAASGSVFQKSSLSATSATVFDSTGATVGAGSVTLSGASLVTATISGNDQYQISGAGAISFYGPAENSLGVGGTWSEYTATVTGNVSVEANTGSLTLNGIALPAGKYSIRTNSLSLAGSGNVASPTFAGSASISLTNATVDLGNGNGSLNVASGPLDLINGAALVGYTGTLAVAPGTVSGSDSVTLNGTASNLICVSTTPNALSTDQNTPISFQTNVSTSFGDSYSLSVSAPPQWNVAIEATGKVTVTPAAGVQSGTYPVQIFVQSTTNPDLEAQSTVDVTVTATAPGATLSVRPDTYYSVSFNGADVPSAFEALIHNTGPTADTYNLTFANVPSGFTVLSTTTSATVPAGKTGILGLYLQRTGTTLPPPGTNLSFTVTATSVTNSAITQTVNVSFTMPTIDAVTVASNPVSVTSEPGSPTTATVTVTNVGNVAANAALSATTDTGLAASGLSNTPVSVGIGQSTTQTVTLTPAAGAALNSTLTATISAGPAATQDEVSVVSVDPTLRGGSASQSPQATGAPPRSVGATFVAGETVDVTADILAGVTSPRQALASYTLTNSSGTVVFTSTPTTINLGDLPADNTVDLGTFSATGLAAGSYTIDVVITETGGQAIAGATGTGTLLIDSPVTAGLSVDAEQVSPGTNTVTSTLTVANQPVIGSVQTDGTASSVAVNGTLGYVAGNKDINVVDISDPSNPKIVGTFGGDKITSADNTFVAVAGNDLIVGAGVQSSLNGFTVLVYTLTDPKNPQFAGSVNVPYAGMAGMTIQGTTAYFPTEGFLYDTSSGSISDQFGDVAAVDFSNPSSPQLLGVLFNDRGAPEGHSGAQWDVQPVASGIAYVAGSTSTGPNTQTGTGQIAVVNTSNSSSLSVISQLALPGTVQALAIGVQGHTALVVGSSGGYLSPFGDPSNIQLTGNVTLTLLDISNPSQPSIIGSTVVTQNTFATYGESTVGELQVVPLGNNQFAINGTLLNGQFTVLTVDATTPTSPAISTFSENAQVSNLAWANGLLLATSANGLQVLQPDALATTSVTAEVDVPNTGATINLNSFSTPPTSITPGSNSTALVWKLSIAPGDNQQITWQSTTSSLLPGQVQQVAMAGSVQFTENGTNETIALPALNVVAIEAPQTVQIPVLVRSAQTVAISQASVDAGSAGNTQLSGTLSELSDTVSLLQATPTDPNLLSRTQLLLNDLSPELTADPVLAPTTSQLVPIQTDANKGDVTDMLTAIPPFFSNVDKLLAVEAAEQFTVTVAPNEVDLPALTGQQKTLTVTVADTGPDPVTVNLSTGALPTGVTAALGQSQITLQPGASQNVSLTLTSNLVSTNIFTLNVQAADSTDSTLATVVHNGTAIVAVRAAAADVLGVTVNPITVNAGAPVAVSASIFNTANASRSVLVHIQVFNSANVVVATPPDVSITLAPTASAVTFNLGTIDTSSLITGVYTLEVSLRASDGTTLPGKNSEAPFLVGLPISATVSASPTTLPPGTSTVTTTITVSNDLTTVKAPVGDIQALYYAPNPFGISPTADGTVFVIQNTSAVPITGGVFKLLSGSPDSFNVGTVPASGQVIIQPGISDDGGSGHTFFNVTGTLLDESDSGPDSSDTQFEFTGLQGSTVIDSGVFTPAATAGPSNDGKAANVNFLGGPNDNDVPSLNVFGPKIVATLYDPPGSVDAALRDVSASPSPGATASPPGTVGATGPSPAATDSPPRSVGATLADPPAPPTPPTFNPPAGDAVKWVGATSGNWDVAANWLDTTTSTNHVPDATDNVTIDASGLTITVEAGNQVAQSLLVKLGSTLDVSGGNLFVTGGAEIDGAVTLGNGNHTLAMGGGATITGSMSWTDGGILNLDGGDLFNTGTLTLSGNNFYLDSRSATGTSNLKGNFYNEGKVVQPSGNLQLFDSVTLNNTSAGTWQFGSDNTDISNQSFSPVVVNSGLFQKTAGTGNSDIQVAISNTGGAFEADTGTLRLNNSADTFAGGVFNADSGATVYLNTGTTGMTFSGMLTGGGAGTVLLDGGTIDLGGDATFNFPAGLFAWYNSTINLNSYTLTNAGALSLGLPTQGTGEAIASVDAGNTALGGTFENQGTLSDQGPTTLYLYDKVVLDNSATGSIQFAGNASGTPSIVVGNDTPSLTNEGTIEKTSGSGTSEIRVPFTYTAGSIKVDSGTLTLDGSSGQIAGTSFTVATGATLDLAGNTGGNVFSGTFTGTGGGTVLLEAGSIVVGSAGATFDFPSGMFQWTGGGINLDGHTLTNTGSMTLANANNVSLFGNDFFQSKNDGNLGGTLNNSGTIVEQGTGSLGFYDSVALNNQAGGTYNFASDGVVYDGQYSPTMANAGTIEKSAGTGTSYIGVPFANNGGAINVGSGTLSLQGNGGISTGGTFTVANGSTLVLAGNNTSGNQYTGTYTGTGGGAVTVSDDSGWIDIGSAGATFNFPAGMLQWTSGVINLDGNTLTNTGGMTVAPTGSGVLLYGNANFSGGSGKGANQGGTLDNQGSIADQGPAAIYLYDSVVLKNDTGGTFNLSGGADLIYENYSSSVNNAGKFTVSDAGGTTTISTPLTNTATFTVAGGELDLTNTVTNRGTLDAGANTLKFFNSTVENPGTIETEGGAISFDSNSTLDNSGTLDVNGGSATLAGRVSQIVNGTLTGGVWIAAGGGTISLPAGITANEGTLILSGAAATIVGTSLLARNDEALSVTSGATLNVAGNFTNNGVLTLGGGSTAGALRPAETTSLAFNGSSDFVSVGNLGARPTQGTISFWINPTTVGNYQNVLTTGPTNANGTGGNQAIRFEEDGSSLYADFGSDTASDNGSSGFSSFLLTNSLTPGAWVNVTVTWDSSANTVTGYLNGAQVFSGTNTNFPSTFGNVTFGLGYASNPAYQRYYNGLLNDVRFYNVARSQADIQSDMTSLLTGSESGLIGYWPLNDGSGTTAKDLTANGHNGTLGGGTAADEPAWISTSAALDVAGNFTQSATGTLDSQLGGTPASGDFGQLAVTGSAAFAGMLRSEFVSGYTPTAGDNFTVATYASTTGTFGAVDLAEMPTVAYTANVGATSLVLTSTAATLTPTQTAVTSSAPNGATYGQLVEYTASVTGAGGTPTGSVQFQIDGLNSGAPITLSSGQATLTLALPAGNHAIAAFYISDNTTFANSDDSATPLTQVVNPATVTPSTIDLYYTTYSPGTVDKVSVSIAAGTATLGTPVPIVQNIPADGLIFLPNGDLMTAAGAASEINPNTGAVTTENQGVNGDHLALDPSGKVVWTSPQPGPLYELPIDPLGPATQVTLAGDDTSVTHIAFDNSGQAFYVNGAPGGYGSFGLISLPAIGAANPVATTQRIYSNLPAAHGITFDPFTGDLFLVGASSVAQIDPNTLKIVSELDFPGGFTFDQGAEDGKGHLYAADNGGHLLIVDYSATGLIGDPRNFVATPFLATALDDVAPLSGLGGAGIPITVTHALPATGYNINPTSITPNPASFSSTNVAWNTTFTPGQPETDQFQLSGQVTNMAPGEVRQISTGTTVTATVTAQDGTQIPVSINLPPLTVAAQHIIELTPPTEAVNQGATAAYTVELSNPLPTNETYTLAVAGLPSGETASLAASVPVPAGQTVDVPLTVSVPLGALQGTQAFLVSAQTLEGAFDSVEGQLSVNATVAVSALAVNLTLTPIQPIAGQTNPALYTITVTNTGDTTDTYDLTGSFPTGFTGSFSQTTISVPPGISNFRDIQLSLTPPAGATAQNYPFTVTATSTTDATVSSQASGAVAVLAQGVQVELTPSSAVPGSTYQLKVTNTGQAADTFNLSLASPGALVSTLGTNQVTLQAGASQTVPVTTGAVNFADQGVVPLTGIATSTTNNSVQSQSTADLAIASTQSMTAAFNPAQQTLVVPAATSFLLDVNNTGNTEDSYSATIVSTTGPVTANLVGLDGQPTQSVPLFILPGLSTGAILLQVNDTGTGQGTVTVLVQSLTNSSIQAAPTATVIVPAPTIPAPTLTLTNNSGLALAESSSTAFTSTLLQATDSDNTVTAANIVYTLTAAPTQGSLSLSGQKLAAGGTFTQDDVNHGRLAYSAGEEGADSFDFTVSAGAAATLSGTFLIATSDPTVAGAGGFTLMATEGSLSTNQTVATFTDPGGAASTASYSAEIDWGDGTTSPGAISFDSQSQVFTVQGQHAYTEQGAYAIQVTLGHEAAPSVTLAASAQVSDPAVVATGGFTIVAVAGSDSPTQTVATFTDPGGAEPLSDYSASIQWGDGATTSGTVSVDATTHVFTVAGHHLYAAAGTSSVSVSLHHEGAPDATATSTAQVSTVPGQTAITLANNGLAVAEGSSASITSGMLQATVTGGEAPAAAIVFTLTAAPTQGTLSLNGQTLAAGGTFTQDDVNHGRLDYTAVEESGDSFGFNVAASGAATISGTFSIAVSDPGVGGTGGFTVAAAEGSNSSVQTVATFTDPGGFEPQASDTAIIDWGDGTSSAGTVVLPTTGTLTNSATGTLTNSATVAGQHTYAEEGNYTIQITLHHEGTPDAAATSTAVVSDPAVMATGGFTYSATEGSAAAAQTVAVFTDPGGVEPLANYSATIDWGDGATATAGSIAVDPNSHLFTVSGQHNYSRVGTYPITVTLRHLAAPAATVTSGAQIVGVTTTGQGGIAAAGLAVSAYERNTPTSLAVATFTDANPSLAPGDFSAAIDWGDGATSAGSVVLSSGGAGGTPLPQFTVNGSHQYLDEGHFTIQVSIDQTAGPASGATSATVTSIATVHEQLLEEGTVGTPNQNYIQEVYRDLFFRQAEPEGRDFWAAQLTQGTPRDQVAHAIVQTAFPEEFQRDAVDALYQQYLGRTPDASGRQYWTDYLYQGGTIEGMSQALASSQEYFNARGGGASDGFLKALFHDALGRPIDSGTLTYFTGLMAKGMSAAEVADAVFSSDEYHRLRVDALFEQFMGRAADTGALGYFAGELDNGATDELVIAQLISSDEYFNHAQV